MRPPFFSVIMPVYNSESYLAQALQSVLEQDFTDFELLIAEGGSSDKSREICLSTADADGRVQVLGAGERMKAGQARNLALERASGEYILFVDSDDYLEQNTLGKIQEAVQESDVLCFGNRRVYFDKSGQIEKEKNYPGRKFSAVNEEEITAVFLEFSKDKTFPFLWNKAFRRELLNKNSICFTDHSVTEDFFFNIKVFDKAKHIRGIEEILYNYRKPAEETLVRSYQSDFFEISKEKYLAEMQFLSARGADTEANRQLFYDSYVRHLLSTMIKNLTLDKHMQDEKIRQMLNDRETREVLGKIRPQGGLIRAAVATLGSGSAFRCRMMARLARRAGFLAR